MRKSPYPHPGEILVEEFLTPMGITQYRIAKEIGVPQRRIGEIVAGARGVTADAGLRLSRFFETADGFWVGLQLEYDAAIAKDLLAETLAEITPWQADKVRAVLLNHVVMHVFGLMPQPVDVWRVMQVRACDSAAPERARQTSSDH